LAPQNGPLLLDAPTELDATNEDDVVPLELPTDTALLLCGPEEGGVLLLDPPPLDDDDDEDDDVAAVCTPMHRPSSRQAYPVGQSALDWHRGHNAWQPVRASAPDRRPHRTNHTVFS